MVIFASPTLLNGCKFIIYHHIGFGRGRIDSGIEGVSFGKQQFK
jgi:hypothetical protein